MIGNIFTAYLWYLELVVIRIICPLCVSLYAVNYALTLIVIIPLFKPDLSDGDLEQEVVITDSARSEN